MFGQHHDDRNVELIQQLYYVNFRWLNARTWFADADPGDVKLLIFVIRLACAFDLAVRSASVF
jgi:hypothetical protein